MCVFAVRHNSGFDMTRSYMACCRSLDLDWTRCRPCEFGFPYGFNMGEGSSFQSHSACSALSRNIDWELISNRIHTSYPFLFVPGDLTPLQTTHAVCVGGRLSIIHLKSQAPRGDLR